MEEEIWKDILGWEGMYLISNKGNVKSLARTKIKTNGCMCVIKERILKPGKLPTHNKKENYYYTVCLVTTDGIKKWFQIHRLVAQHFIPNPQYLPQVNHKNEIKTDNRTDNLEWVNNRENNTHYQRIKTSKYTGVCKDRKSKTWKSSIQIDGKIKHLGVFETEESASLAYQEALQIHNLTNRYSKNA